MKSERSFPHFNIRAKLSIFTSSLVVSLIGIISAVFIIQSSNNITASLIERGVSLVNSISVISANSIAGYQYFDVQNGLNSAVMKDAEIVYAYLESLDHRPVVYSDKIIRDEKLIASSYGGLDRFVRKLDYGRQGGNVEVTLLVHGGEECIDVRAPVSINNVTQSYLRIGLTTKYIRSMIVFGLMVSIGLAAFFIIAGIFTSMVFSSMFTRPILKLKEAALQLGMKNFDYAVDIQSQDELGLLAGTFNSMRSEIKLYTVSLNDLIEKLKELDRMKTDFLSNVSHELRTPLTSIIALNKIVTRKLTGKIFPLLSSSDPKTEKEVYDILQSMDILTVESGRLHTLITNLIDIAAIESGEVVWEDTPVSAAVMIDKALEDFQIVADRKKAELAVVKQVEDGLPDIHGDKKRLVQVVSNILSNAFKFTERGEIRINAARSGDSIVISVADTGPGIEDGKKELVFDRFRQGGDILTSKPGGVGLGLPISKLIAEHYGGRVWFESDAGRGSVFHFSMPIGKK